MGSFAADAHKKFGDRAMKLRPRLISMEASDVHLPNPNFTY